MSDALRNAFEAYFADSRRGKGASKAPTFARLADGTYADDPTQRHWWTWQNAARAALSAPPPVVPAGWRLVPVEPTEEMDVAGALAHEQSNCHDHIGPINSAWSAMLAAAPQAPTHPGQAPTGGAE